MNLPNPFSFLERGFSHGVHPPHLKSQTEDRQIQRMPFVAEYVMPLNQHLGVPSKAVVEAGQSVQRGELIAEPGGFVSVALHSPVTGRVKAIADFRAADGNFSTGIQIEADNYSTQAIDANEPIDWQSLSTEAFIAEIQKAGIVGMGGAAFPAHVKFSIPDGSRIRHLLINGAECEPYLTNDHRLMMENSDELFRGAEIIRQKLGAEDTVIGVELNKPLAIQILRQRLPSGQPVRIVPLEVKYPQGAEKMLIKAVYGREVPAGRLPRDVQVNVNNVSTVVAIANYFEKAMPLIERVITLSGPGVTYPANLIVPLGTPIREVLAFCGGLREETREVVMGGPMMGRPVSSLDAPVVKGSSGILAMTEAGLLQKKEYPCIRCGRCVEVCPYFLNPARLARLSRVRRYEEMKGYHVMDCVECGCCTYSCPSAIPIVQLIRTGKDHLRRIKEPG
ncbi:MAG: electron transport complex subunit RsxC [Gammaproteobacteria bacterium]|nr:electron transport complex subunit RsxC [Gammaproteobacteria bacterium]